MNRFSLTQNKISLDLEGEYYPTKVVTGFIIYSPEHQNVYGFAKDESSYCAFVFEDEVDAEWVASKFGFVDSVVREIEPLHFAIEHPECLLIQNITEADGS